MEGEKLNRGVKFEANVISPLLSQKGVQSKTGHTQMKCWNLYKRECEVKKEPEKS